MISLGYNLHYESFFMFKVALAGHQNVGKTSLFNLLTGKNNKTGNWEGVTVELDRGPLLFRNKVEIFDLPGLKSLQDTTATPDQIVAKLFLEEEKPDLVINLVTLNNLEEELLLSFELYELGLSLLIVVIIDNEEVIEFTFLNSPVFTFHHKARGMIRNLIKEIDYLCYNKENNLSHDEYYNQIGCNNVQSKAEILNSKKLYIQGITKSINHKEEKNYTGLLDKILLNPIVALPIFFMIICTILGCTIWGGNLFKESFENFANTVFIEPIIGCITKFGGGELLLNLYQDGIGSGIKTLFGFIPLLFLLYFMLGIIEESGYMARISLIMGEKIGKIGLSGKAIIPLVLGFGCNVPAIMGTRIIGDPKERLLTILLIPFMSCGARLTIFALFASNFFPDSPILVIAFLYLFSIFLALLVAFILQKQFKKEKNLLPPLLPSYKRPQLGKITKQVLYKIKHFVLHTGGLILGTSFLLYSLTALQLSHLKNFEIKFNPDLTEDSFLIQLGKTITPIFSPLGIASDNWPAAVSLLTGVVAKEVVASTLITLYEIKKDEAIITEEPIIKGFFNENQAFAYLLFVLLYFPCVTVFAVMKKEVGLKIAIYSSIFYTLLAYFIATIFYQISLLTGAALEVNLLLLVLSLLVLVYPSKKLYDLFMKNN